MDKQDGKHIRKIGQQKQEIRKKKRQSFEILT